MAGFDFRLIRDVGIAKKANYRDLLPIFLLFVLPVLYASWLGFAWYQGEVAIIAAEEVLLAKNLEEESLTRQIKMMQMSSSATEITIPEILLKDATSTAEILIPLTSIVPVTDDRVGEYGETAARIVDVEARQKMGMAELLTTVNNLIGEENTSLSLTKLVQKIDETKGYVVQLEFAAPVYAQLEEIVEKLIASPRFVAVKVTLLETMEGQIALSTTAIFLPEVKK
jgi:hypothetical protein